MARDDIPAGPAGNDMMEGSPGADSLTGSAGMGALIGGLGKGTYFGGIGSDSIDLTEVAQGADRVVINAGDSLVTDMDKVAHFDEASTEDSV